MNNSRNSLQFLMLLFILVTGCKKPHEGIKLQVSNDFLKYSVLVQLKEEGTGKIPEGKINLQIAGDDKNFVYEIAGRKNYTVHDGSITLVLSPDRLPAPGQPVKFTIEASASGYLPVVKDVIINSTDKNQRVTIAMTNFRKPPKGVVFDVKNYPVSKGILSKNTATGANRETEDSVYYDDNLTTVFLPKGTAFNYYRREKVGSVKKTVEKDSVMVNGSVSYFEKTTHQTFYGDVDYDYPVYSNVKYNYTGDSLKVVCAYSVGWDDNMNIIHTNYYYDTSLIKIMTGAAVRGEDLLYKSAIKKKLAAIYFIGKIKSDIGGEWVDINLFPDNNAKWFTSYVLNETTVNPLTNHPIAEGDSIEVGIDYNTKETVRSVILKSANGQLRVQCQSFDVGYYYRGLYTYSFSYLLNSNIPDTSIIPDPENLRGYASIRTNIYHFYPSFAYYSGEYDYSYKIVSAKPIVFEGAEVMVEYCGKQLNKRNLSEGYSNIFDNSYFALLPAPITFDFRLYCSGSVFRPNYYGSGIINNNAVYFMNVTDGKWKTRGFNLGQKYAVSSWYGNTQISDTLKVTQPYNIIEKSSQKLCEAFGR